MDDNLIRGLNALKNIFRGTHFIIHKADSGQSLDWLSCVAIPEMGGGIGEMGGWGSLGNDFDSFENTNNNIRGILQLSSILTCGSYQYWLYRHAEDIWGTVLVNRSSIIFLSCKSQFWIEMGCVIIRVVESESREVGKSLKIGKNRIKSEKSDLISY